MRRFHDAMTYTKRKYCCASSVIDVILIRFCTHLPCAQTQFLTYGSVEPYRMFKPYHTPFSRPLYRQCKADMICSSSGVQEDPYDLVMRRAADIKVTIVPDSGSDNYGLYHFWHIIMIYYTNVMSMLESKRLW